MLNHIIGNLEDQTGIFFRSWWYRHYSELGGLKTYSEYYGYPTGTDLKIFTNQPLLSLTYDAMVYWFNPLIFTNIYTVLQVILNIILANVLLRHLGIDKKISFLVSLVFIFSPFLYYNIGIHPSLLTLWPFIWFLKRLTQFEAGVKSNFITGFSLAVTFLFNNYFGYFGLILMTVFIFTNILLNRNNVIAQLRRLVLMSASFLSVTIAGLLPYLLGSKPGVTVQAVTRPLEDFFYFSSRPWYFFLPSPDNPWIGKTTTNIINWLQNDWGYWLTSNYFPSEHTTLFLGYTTFLFAILGAYYLLFKTDNNEIKQRNSILALGISAIVLMMLSLPPYFTISMYKIYTPSYLLLNVFPYFRVLARMGIIILLIELIFCAYGYQYFIRILKSKWSQASWVVILPFIIVSLMEFYVPITFVKVEEPPQIFQYIKTNTDEESVLAVYPYNGALPTLFWISEHERRIMNPRDYTDASRHFISEEFTQELKTDEGLQRAKELGATHLVFFRYGGNKDRIDELNYFDNSPKLEKIIEFNSESKDEQSYFLYKVKIWGNTKQTSGVLYKIL